MKVCIDTCAYTAFENGNTALLELFNTCDELIFPITVIGELQFGFSYGSRYESNMKRLQIFIVKANAKIVHTTMETAFRYGRLAAELKKNGTPIPQNDIWIAAMTMECGAHLTTLDSDFLFVQGLIVEKF
jgi:predicted nucleic acid-binding protein